MTRAAANQDVPGWDVLAAPLAARDRHAPCQRGLWGTCANTCPSTAGDGFFFGRLDMDCH